ncbi:MAG TPA: FHA domain-containing protein [Myxococcota bacterium]|nr:FHA domain-containing protein [Myxococcota bacterium]
MASSGPSVLFADPERRPAFWSGLGLASTFTAGARAPRLAGSGGVDFAAGSAFGTALRRGLDSGEMGPDGGLPGAFYAPLARALSDDGGEEDRGEKVSARVMVLLLKDDKPVKAVGVGERGLHLGRGRDADISLVEPSVSTDHARIWCEGERVLLRDLGSRNGTYLNEQRITSTVEVADADEIRLGGDICLRIRVLGGMPELKTDVALVQVDAGLRTPLHLGENPVDDIVVVLDRQGGLTLEGPKLSRPLTPGEDFEVGGLRYRVETQGGTSDVRTVELEGGPPPIRVEARLDGPTGPEARFTDIRDNSVSVLITAATQAEVVFVLARTAKSDLKSRVEDPGWLNNGELRQAVWGRSSERLHRSRLPVVLHRIRKALESAGLSEACIDRRRGATRLWVVDVEVD